MKHFRLLSLFALCALTALAAGIDGKWKATMQFGDRTIENTYTFKADGDKLTGKLTTARGESDIQEGKITGDDITFKVTRQTPNGEVTSTYTGKLKGDELQLKTTMRDREVEMTAKRVE